MISDSKCSIRMQKRKATPPFAHVALSAWIVAAGLLMSGTVVAQAYPVKPIRLIVPFPPGGPVDLLGRLVGQKLTEKWGQQVLVDNRAGANTIIGMTLAAKAAPDGYTLILANIAMAINPGLVAKMPYDGTRDFAPISNIVYSSFVLVAHRSLPVNSVKDLIALAKARPGQLTFGSGGTGSPTHLSGELLKTMAGVDMVHVAYKGGSPAVMSVVTGETAIVFSDPLIALPHVKSGKLRALAVTSAKRFVAAPDIPTVAEGGLRGYESGTWRGILAPAGTPRSIIDRWHDELVNILAQPEVKGRLSDIGAFVIGDTPEQFAAFIKTETEKWTRIARGAGVPQFKLPE